MSYFSIVIQGVLAAISNPVTMLLTFVGTFMGLVFGALPGLTATMGVALLIPLTYTLEPVAAISMMLALFVGGMAGGAVSATLLNIPGTPSAVVTTMDGYPMAQQGRAGEALGWAALASGFGSLISWLVLVFLAPLLAVLCTSFSAPEYAAMALFGLTIIAAVSGKNLLKGLVAGFLGVMLALVGVDPIWGNLRFTFGNVNLMSGISLMPALIGFYSVPQILKSCTEKGNPQGFNVKINNLLPTLEDIWKSKWHIIRSSIIGTVVGIIPATGGSIAAFLSYDQAKRFSKDPETFGKGNHNGIIASEAANNGVCGGAMVPLLTLGIPGDPVTAVLLGGLLIHGLRPGPHLFTEHPDFIVGIFTTMLIATILMVLMQLVAIQFFIKILSIPINYLIGTLVILSMLGSYALRNNVFDVGITLVLGFLGYLMSRGGFPTAPTVLGLVLGGMLESEMRTALNFSRGSWSVFFTRPVPLVLILISIMTVVSQVVKANRPKKPVIIGGMEVPDEDDEE